MESVVSAAAVVEGKTVVMGKTSPLVVIWSKNPLSCACRDQVSYPSPSTTSKITFWILSASICDAIGSRGRTRSAWTPNNEEMVPGMFEMQKAS